MGKYLDMAASANLVSAAEVKERKEQKKEQKSVHGSVSTKN